MSAPWPQAKLEAVRRAYEAGEHAHTIAAAAGVNVSLIYRRARRGRWTRPKIERAKPAKPAPARIDRAAELTAIQAFIKRKGVKRCPTAVCAPTETDNLDPAAARSLWNLFMRRERDSIAQARQRNGRGVGRRFATRHVEALA